jgi:diguanylate cyclase
MRYKETREQSAELLRMVLPLMSKHAAGLHPLSYAVWYEYCAGTNPQLKAAVDQRLQSGVSLTDDDIARLFDEHVVMRDIDTSVRMRMELSQIIDGVSDATERTGTDVSKFGENVDAARQVLETKPDPAAASGVVDSLIGDTRRVKISTDGLRQYLRKSAHEVVRLREELEVAQGQAHTDPLTGLLNRRGFDHEVRKILAKGLQRCSVVAIDIDHFKRINDTYGHLLGDRVIATVAQVIRSCLDGRGQAARIGGEEFAMVLTATSAAGALELAERIRAAVEKGRIKRADRDEIVGGVTISIGIATHMEKEELEQLLERADKALYRSKQDGRNRITVSTP